MKVRYIVEAEVRDDILRDKIVDVIDITLEYSNPDEFFRKWIEVRKIILDFVVKKRHGEGFIGSRRFRLHNVAIIEKFRLKSD